MSPRWRVAHDDAYLWRRWDDEAVIFVHATGDTHALSVEASALLETMRGMQDSARTADDWLEAAGFERAAGDEDPESLMRQLEALGIVRRLGS